MRVKEDLALVRKGLWPLSLLYGTAMAGRNWLFDLGLRKVQGVELPVVSVGNLAAGGTGKTPLVVWLVDLLRSHGLRPGVLARGYGRRPGDQWNDEGCLLARRFPDLCQVQDEDRVAGARRLAALGVDLIVIDDGFQHRRLRRDCDIVCLDMEKPFAGGMLPSGLLREFPRGLRRAQAIVLTRAGGFTDQAVQERMASLAACGSDGLQVFASDHVPARLVEMPVGTELSLSALENARVHLLSSIARPAVFEATIRDLGAEVVAHTMRQDHYHHTQEELEAAATAAEADGAMLVTTEKDDVKLEEMPIRRWVLEVDLEFLGAAPGLELLGVEPRLPDPRPRASWIRSD